MTFLDKMRGFLDQGVTASKDFVVKAGAKAQDLGQKGVLKLEIAQLEHQAQKLISKLGAEAYAAFAERGEASLAADAAPVRGLLAEIDSVKNAIDKKEAELAETAQ